MEAQRLNTTIETDRERERDKRERTGERERRSERKSGRERRRGREGERERERKISTHIVPFFHSGRIAFEEKVNDFGVVLKSCSMDGEIANLRYNLEEGQRPGVRE